jgi:hypothetical protein
MLDEIQQKETRQGREQHLDAVLLKLKYAVKQELPCRWREIINVYSEKVMSEKKGVKREVADKRRKRVEHLSERWSEKTQKAASRKVVML